MADTTATPQRSHAEAVHSFFQLFEKGRGVAAQASEHQSKNAVCAPQSTSRSLWGDNGLLCVVHIHLLRSGMLMNYAQATAADDAAPARLEAQRLVAECRHILKSRLSANTCLIGRCFAVEEDFFVRFNTLMVENGHGCLTALTSITTESKNIERQESSWLRSLHGHRKSRPLLRLSCDISRSSAAFAHGQRAQRGTGVRTSLCRPHGHWTAH